MIFPTVKKLVSISAPLVICILFAAALWLLHKELQAHHLSEFLTSFAAIKGTSLVMAIMLTVASYVVLTSYDGLALQFLHKDIQNRIWFPISLVSSAISNNFGTLLGGSTIRYRMYSLCGVTGTEVAAMSAFISVTFWAGIVSLAGLTFVCVPLSIPDELHFPISDTRLIGWICIAIASAYVAICFTKSRLSWSSQFPSGPMALCQLMAVCLDLLVTVSVLYWLLPSSIQIEYFELLSIYLLAVMVGIVSQVPGGLGVFELVFLWLIRPEHADELFGSLLAYRAIYYLLPLAIALIAISLHEMLLHRSTVAKAAISAEKIISLILPRLMAFMVFSAGTVLLFSSATPAEHGRIQWLRGLLPLPIIEASHFLGSIAGVGLLLLASGLRRRVQAAFWCCMGLLGAGVFFSIAKGLDFEEATVLLIMLGLLAISRRHYYRQGAIWSDRFTGKWFSAIVIVVAGSVWLMNFAFKHIEYTHELWWQFAMDSDAPRSLRAIAGTIVVLVAFCCWRLMKPYAKLPNVPSTEDLKAVTTIVTASPDTNSHLALLGDKRFLLSPNRDAFIMFGAEGRSYIALGDPVGSQDAARELAWDFRELCDIADKWPVFYQVADEKVSLYVDLGLSLMKLGEEARVPLDGFSLEGSNRRSLRRNHKQVVNDGFRVEIIPPPIADDVMSELRRISNEWLSEKHTAEKGFSLGSFNDVYLRDCPIAIVRKDDLPIAFANLWYGSDGQEVSLDLMRFDASAPSGTMEFLFVELMLRGSEMGFQWFNLGMAPLSGIDAKPLAPLWSQTAGFVFRHGEQFYNFKGLRQYKEKFHPVWKAKYLAYPGKVTLPIVLANVTTLISGGLVKTLTK